ncbi:MAG: type II secretion system protein [Magnetococcales bacterium]|nr:type II secretion system protein [Magnetococcales bacterium]
MDRQKGFTLVELSLTIAIIGVLAVTALNRWPQATLELGAARQQLAMDILKTRAMAMNRQGSFTIRRVNNLPASYEILDPGQQVVFTSALDGATVAAFSLVFDGLGSPGNNDASISVIGGEGSSVITVYGTTGGVYLP